MTSTTDSVSIDWTSVISGAIAGAATALTVSWLFSKTSERRRRKISTPLAPRAIGPYSQAIAADEELFVSGCIGFDPAKMTFVSNDVQGQTRRALENLKAIVEAGGSSLSQVLKVTILLRDMKDYGAVNKIYAEFFPPENEPPARACFAVSGLPANALIEIECVARLA